MISVISFMLCVNVNCVQKSVRKQLLIYDFQLHCNFKAFIRTVCFCPWFGWKSTKETTKTWKKMSKKIHSLYVYIHQRDVWKSKGNTWIFVTAAYKHLSLHRGEEVAREKALAQVKWVYFKGFAELSLWLPGHPGTKCSFCSVSVSVFSRW